MQRPYLTFTPDFEQDLARIKEFLRNFETVEGKRREKKYMTILQQVANKETKLVEINTEDLESFFSSEEQLPLLEGIFKNTKRYLSLFYDAVDNLLPFPTKQLNIEETMEGKEEITQRQRVQNIQNQNQPNPQVGQPINKSIDDLAKEGIPKEIIRTYELIIIPGGGSKSKIQRMRELKSLQIGSLIQVKGIVVRATDVKPFIKVACYSCDICGYETYQIISGRTYMPLVDCTSQQCRNNRSHGKLYPMNRTSKFVAFQEIKIQEPSNEVPVGTVPRSITIYAFGHNVRQCGPGDSIICDGIFLPSMMQSGRTGRSRLIHDTYIEAFKITKEKKSHIQTKEEKEQCEKEALNFLQNNNKAYDTLAMSIAPEIYGMLDVKKALLLLLVGGVDKEMEDGMKIRGNLNILLMGDPGIAKSQLLKYISHLSPRGVYTTGKGSSGVGLTAAVVKDNITNDLVLEGGALVLADMGVCCIDEFDKMSDYDRANIHEVMEQQTVSIAKAGITARLNARTSVLAAANPLYGRYNTSISPHENINLPAALLSRFDLIFLLLDTPNKENDLKLAEHVTHVHREKQPPKVLKNMKPVPEEKLRAIIANAKNYSPVIPKELHNFIVQKYVEKRNEESKVEKHGYQYITPRSLLAILRLAQALAKLRMENEVNQDDIDEALRLVEAGKSSVEGEKEVKTNVVKTDAKSTMFSILREHCINAKDYTVNYSEIEKKIVSNSTFTKKQFRAMVQEYTNLNILYVNDNQNEITLVV